MSEGIRRVVTGLDEQGKSTILVDDRVSPAFGLIWRSDAVPVDNSSREDAAAAPFDPMSVMRTQGSIFFVSEIPPSQPGQEPFIHATNTIDYIYVLSGRVKLIVETGSVELGPNECVVDRGIVHGWEVLGDEPARLLSVMLPAHPVGNGATV
jgi:mannose-6-phosphate isomerase-like protein (cupin superfamily)